MASYGLKYRAEFKNTREQEYQLDIYRRGYSGSSKTIMDLCGCVLEIQGAQSDITAPIIKTQLRVSMVDAWDIAETGSEKWGDWQEFFTPDATLYKLQLRQKLSGVFQNIWSGYVTPDSWKEDLGYRNAITITARDNIGHLKDFQFDMTGDALGLVTIEALINAAMDKIDFPMGFSLMTGGESGYKFPYASNNGSPVYLTDACVNASLFDGMDWYAVLEQTLEAIGYTMRFNGANGFVCAPLRNIINPDGSSSGESSSLTVEFYGGSMELSPAVKEINEEIEYKIQKDVEQNVIGGLQYSSAPSYLCFVEGNGDLPTIQSSAPLDKVTNPGNSIWTNGSEMLDPSGREADDYLINSEGADGWKQFAMIPGNRYVDDPSTSFRLFTKTSAVGITINFAPYPLAFINSGYDTGKMTEVQYALSKIKYQVRYVSDDQSTVRYWSGAGWLNDHEHTITRDYDSENEYGSALDIVLSECKDIDSGQIIVTFSNIIYKRWDDEGNGVYARVKSVVVSLSSSVFLGSNKVRTVNNTAYNVKIERKPLLGALSKNVGFFSPANYQNGLFYYPGSNVAPRLYPYKVHFTGQTSANDIPLPVAIHEQILCFYFGAARVLSGRLAPINKAMMRFDRVFLYKGVKYLLQGGTFDMFSGIVESAVLREYAVFDDLWTGTPSWSDDADYNSSSTGGGGSSSAGGGGGSRPETDPVFSASPAAGIPAVTLGDNGKILKVSNGAYALGGVPLATSSALGGIKVGYTQSGKNYPVQLDANDKAYVNVPWEDSSIDGVSRKAPKLVIYRGYNERQQAPFAPYLQASHPAIGAVTGAEFVLMVMSPRRMRNTGTRVGKARKSWGAALGATGEGGLTFSDQVTLLDLRTYILQNYVSVYGQSTENMTYATYQSLTGATGFGHPNGTEAYYRKKIKRSRVFGIAVRWPNPAFSEMASGPLSDHTTEIQENGVSYQRWIYSDVAPIRVFAEISNLDGVASHNGGVIGFQLLP